MLVEILKGVVAQGQPHREGSRVELSDSEAKALIAMGKAKKVLQLPAEPASEDVKPTRKKRIVKKVN